MKGKKLALLCLSFMIALGLGSMPAGTEAASKERQICTPAEMKLNQNLRKLWSDHVIWTRLYLVSNLAGLEDQEPVLARLLQNQKDIGNAIKPIYGEAAGNKLTELLTEHIVLAGKLVEVLKAGRTEEAGQINREWFRNADDIAKFLSSANPNWSYNQLKDMLETHLKLITEDVSARMNKDWNASIAAFDKGVLHILTFADVLSQGIVRQFPDKFK